MLATIGFAIGTSIERRNSTHESAAHLRAEGATAPAASSVSTGESPATHAAESGGETTKPSETPASGQSGESATAHAAENHGTSTGETHRELRPLGVNIESVPFIVLAALVSLGLAGLGWVRPRWLLGLILIAVAMTIFGVLDVREAFHQSDEHKTELVILAAMIAACISPLPPSPRSWHRLGVRRARPPRLARSPRDRPLDRALPRRRTDRDRRRLSRLDRAARTQRPAVRRARRALPRRVRRRCDLPAQQRVRTRPRRLRRRVHRRLTALGRRLDGFRPDRSDIGGGLICLAGVRSSCTAAEQLRPASRPTRCPGPGTGQDRYRSGARSCPA